MAAPSSEASMLGVLGEFFQLLDSWLSWQFLQPTNGLDSLEGMK